MRRLLPFVLLALTIAVGVALAPYVWWLAVLAVLWCAVGIVLELLRREIVADATGGVWWYEAMQDRLDPLRAQLPRWIFDWRGTLVILSPLWITVVALTVLPFVMR